MLESTDIPKGNFCCRVDIETFEIEFCKYYKDSEENPKCLLKDKEIPDGTKICGENIA